MLFKEILQRYPDKLTSVQLYASTFESPLGLLVGIADEDHMLLLSFEDSKNIEKQLQALQKEHSCTFVEDSNNRVLEKLKQELAAYFDGELKEFTIQINVKGSEFQKEVWKKLQEIPYATTQWYGELAAAIGRAGSARAVGAACGANAHVLLIPCHRLVASSSKGGFSCGLDRKEWLLGHEKKHNV